MPSLHAALFCETWVALVTRNHEETARLISQVLEVQSPDAPITPPPKLLTEDLARWFVRSQLEGQQSGLIPPLPLSQARLHAWLGEQDEALDMVQIAIEQNDFGLLFLAVDPRLDPLREHPRFVSLSKAWNERERDP